jgi:DNA-binding transcriptional MerR regulator
MRIGEAARLWGLEASAIRFYETHGVVPTQARPECCL